MKFHFELAFNFLQCLFDPINDRSTVVCSLFCALLTSPFKVFFLLVSDWRENMKSFFLYHNEANRAKTRESNVNYSWLVIAGISTIAKGYSAHFFLLLRLLWQLFFLFSSDSSSGFTFNVMKTHKKWFCYPKHKIQDGNRKSSESIPKKCIQKEWTWEYDIVSSSAP